MISTTTANGTPTLTKSPKRYLPGPSTSVFTGDDTGVMNAVEAASATVLSRDTAIRTYRLQ